MAPHVDADYKKEIEKARRDLRALIYTESCAPLMLRLAWHDAGTGTYDAKTKKGGTNIRNKQELNHNSNNDLKGAVNLCKAVKDKHPKITYADLYQLAGIVAVEITGGPTIEFSPGREDSSESPEERQPPDAKQGATDLMEVLKRMGLTDAKEIVSLSGGHTLVMRCRPHTGKAHQERSGFEGPWSYTKFDNSYFQELLRKESNDLPKPPTDTALVDDPKFREHVERYAKDEDAFFADYAASHKKLSELGFKPRTGLPWTRPPRT